MAEPLPTLRRDDASPVVTKEQVTYARAAGAFNPGAVICHRTSAVVLLVRPKGLFIANA